MLQSNWLYRKFLHFNFFLIVWEKVKNAVKDTTGKVKDFLQDKLEVLKPKIMAALEKAKADVNGFKEVVIEGSKRLFVRAKAKGVEIIADLKGGEYITIKNYYRSIWITSILLKI